MRVLLDNNVNYRFGQLLPGHEIVHVQDVGWEHLRNGELLARAEENQFHAFVTADKSLPYQQSIAGRQISVLVLNSLFIKWENISPLALKVLDALLDLKKGQVVVIDP